MCIPTLHLSVRVAVAAASSVLRNKCFGWSLMEHKAVKMKTAECLKMFLKASARVRRCYKATWILWGSRVKVQ